MRKIWKTKRIFPISKEKLLKESKQKAKKKPRTLQCVHKNPNEKHEWGKKLWEENWGKTYKEKFHSYVVCFHKTNHQFSSQQTPKNNNTTQQITPTLPHQLLLFGVSSTHIIIIIVITNLLLFYLFIFLYFKYTSSVLRLYGVVLHSVRAALCMCESETVTRSLAVTQIWLTHTNKQASANNNKSNTQNFI